MCPILKLDNLWRESPIVISLYVDSKGTFPESSYMQVGQMGLGTMARGRVF